MYDVGRVIRRRPGAQPKAALTALMLAIVVSACTDAPRSKPLATQITAAPPTTRSAADPGSQPWMPVTRDQVAAACGLDPVLLERVAPQFATTPYTLVRYGQLCWSGGYLGGATTPYEVFSITKTFGAILFGMVASRSRLSDSDSVGQWIPQAELGDINPAASLAHILAMTSTKGDLRYGMKGAWRYDADGSREINALVGVMNRAIAGEPDAFPGVANVKELAERELFAPLGMNQTSWPGETIHSSLVSTVEDMSRLGLLLLRKGRWNGQQLLDESFVYRMTHPAFPDTNTGYGYLTQMNAERGWTYSSGTADLACSPYSTWTSYPHPPFFESPDANGGSPFAPDHDIGLIWAAGALGQKISVHRGLDLVITVRDDILDLTAIDVFAGAGLFEGHKRVWRLIRPALVALDPVYAGDEEGFCRAYQRSAHAPDLLSPWSAAAAHAF